MKPKKIWTVYLKEIKETLRDRRTLFITVFMPILLYPLLFLIISQAMTLGTTKFPEEKSVVSIFPAVDAKLDSIIRADENLEVVTSNNPFKDLKAKKIHAYVHLLHYETGDSLRIIYDAALGYSRVAKDRLERIIDQHKIMHKYNKQQAVEIINLPAQIGAGTVNIATPDRLGNMLVGSIIPVILIVTLILGALYPAIDLTAGEKERGTLETILTVPIQRVELLFGKYLTVVTMALITGILNLLSMLMTYSLGLVQMEVLVGNINISLSPVALLALFIMLIPLTLFISAAILAVCLFARSFKEAQNMATPFYLFLILPALLALAPGFQISQFSSFVPILNVSLLFKEIMLNNYPIHLIVTSFISNSLFAFIGISFVSRLMNTEEILFADGNGWQFSFKRSEIVPTEVFQPANVISIFAIIMLLMFYIGSIIQLKYRHWGILGTQWFIILLPVLFSIWYHKLDFKKALHLKRFNFSAFIGTLCISIGGLGLTTWLARLQVHFFPQSVQMSEMLEKIMNFKTLGISPLVGFFIFAISPAICEELLFRGALLSSLKKKLPPLAAISIVALLFGVFHIYIFRILPTAVLGFLLTFIVYRTGSIYLGMIGHALNNGLALMIVSAPFVKHIIESYAGGDHFYLFISLGTILLLLTGFRLIKNTK